MPRDAPIDATAPAPTRRDLVRAALFVAAIFVLGAVCGCAGPSAAFVEAYASYRATVGREHEANLERIQIVTRDAPQGRTLTADEIDDRRGLHADADQRIAEAREKKPAPVEGTGRPPVPVPTPRPETKPLKGACR